MTEYKADVKCPNCGRCPNVRFSGDEVERSKRERQAAHVISVQCQRCRSRYWIRARDIARATAEGGPELPQDFPERADLMRAGFRTVDELRKLDDLTDIPGIGAAKARRIMLKLDATPRHAVA